MAPAARAAVGVVLLAALAAPAVAQQAAGAGGAADSVVAPVTTPPVPRRFSWPAFGAGFLTSLLAHEAAHLASAFFLGGQPSVGFDRGRPVVYSGIDPQVHPGDQFIFSASGMAVQLAVNEVILGSRHAPEPAGAFERGVLAGGIGTVLFYFTVGRNSPVSDVDHMARASGVSKWWLTAIYGGVAASDVARVAVRSRYAPHLFALPGPRGELVVGMNAAF